MTWLCFQDVDRRPHGLLYTKSTGLYCNIGVLILNILLTPVILLLHSIIIYLLPCVYSSIVSCLCKIAFSSYGCLSCCKVFEYTDREFLPDNRSLGNVKMKQEIVWKRAQDFITEEATNKKAARKMNRLIDYGFDPTDICQGQLGDCWLLSALASLSTHPHTLLNIFVSNQFNPRGKYTVKLWDETGGGGKWVYIHVDDYIPVDKTKELPVFSKPHGNEMWVMLLEKAFAKYLGSYAATEGGHSLYAMNVVTGNKVNKFSFTPSTGNWSQLEMSVTPSHEVNHKAVVNFFSDSSNPPINSDEMYNLLAEFYQKGFILAAGTSGHDNTIEDGRGKSGGIVPGHAYTILQVYSPLLTTDRNIKLLKIRNPWGSFEWTGDWGDESPLWNQHPQIALEMGNIRKGNANDGVFHMNWSDFIKHFDTVDVCYTSRDLTNFHLHVFEEFSVFGSCVGCILGCLRYWILCAGFYSLWFPRDSREIKPTKV